MGVVERAVRRRVLAYPEESALIKSGVDFGLMAGLMHASWSLPRGGEEAMNAMLLPGAFAKRSLVGRFPSPPADLVPPPGMPVSLIYGDPDYDWMDSEGGLTLKRKLLERHDQATVTLRTVPSSGHMVMLDNPAGMVHALTDTLVRA